MVLIHPCHDPCYFPCDVLRLTTFNSPCELLMCQRSILLGRYFSKKNLENSTSNQRFCPASPQRRCDMLRLRLAAGSLPLRTLDVMVSHAGYVWSQLETAHLGPETSRNHPKHFETRAWFVPFCPTSHIVNTCKHNIIRYSCLLVLFPRICGQCFLRIGSLLWAPFT